LLKKSLADKGNKTEENKNKEREERKEEKRKRGKEKKKRTLLLTLDETTKESSYKAIKKYDSRI